MCFVCPSKTDRCGILGAPENIFSGTSRTFSLGHCHAEPEIPFAISEEADVFPRG